MITSFINRLLNTRDNIRAETLKEIKGLPLEKAQKQLSRYLFDICVENALSFVKEEYSKAGSPFRGSHRHKLFHEMLAINFWLVDKNFSKASKAIIGEIHNLYNMAYAGSGEYFIEPGSLEEKYKAYHELWNDVTGHQDLFGSKATKNIFGDAGVIPVEQTCFWIISHAHDSLKTFSEIKKRCPKVP
ncbi:MAG: hypothetical protein HY758_11675 [Nitrospirae bacterium]|nr:hypothetical protein [Nitrospirota bacterium]